MQGQQIHPRALQIHHAKYGEMALLLEQSAVTIAQHEQTIAQMQARIAELEAKYEPKDAPSDGEGGG